MKSFVYLLTVLFSSNTWAKQTIFENSTIQAFICSRCTDATQPGIAVDMKTRLKNLDEYFDGIEDSKNMLFCTETKFQIAPIVKQLTTDVKPCFLNPNETYIPDFMYEGFVEFLEFVCANRTIEIFYSDQGSDCKQALFEYEEGGEFKNCTCQLLKMFNAEVLTYEDLCFDLKSARDCMGEALSHACPYFAAFRTLNFQFFRSVGKLCGNGSVPYTSILVWVITFLINLRNFNVILL